VPPEGLGRQLALMHAWLDQTRGTAGLVEPGVHQRQLAAEPLGRHGSPHPHRKLPLRRALGLLG